MLLSLKIGPVFIRILVRSSLLGAIPWILQGLDLLMNLIGYRLSEVSSSGVASQGVESPRNRLKKSPQSLRVLGGNTNRRLIVRFMCLFGCMGMQLRYVVFKVGTVSECVCKRGWNVPWLPACRHARIRLLRGVRCREMRPQHLIATTSAQLEGSRVRVSRACSVSSPHRY